LAVSHAHPGEGGTLQAEVAVQVFSVELCVTLVDLQTMQSPGSIRGFAGVKTRPPLPNRTVGVRGAARFAHWIGVPLNEQLVVMQSFTANDGAKAASTPAVTTRTPTVPKRSGTK
jgi:hypothetical protein